jgi:hypothetical protein
MSNDRRYIISKQIEELSAVCVTYYLNTGKLPFTEERLSRCLLKCDGCYNHCIDESDLFDVYGSEYYVNVSNGTFRISSPGYDTIPRTSDDYIGEWTMLPVVSPQSPDSSSKPPSRLIPSGTL